MAFDSFGEFLAMGNHGFYVWLAYGLTFIVLAGLAWQSLAAHSRVRRELAAQRLRAAAAQSTPLSTPQGIPQAIPEAIPRDGHSTPDATSDSTTATEKVER